MHHFSLPVLLMLCVIHLHAQRNPAPNQVLTNPVQIKNLESVNTPGLEFSPAFYLNGIVFCSSGDDIPKPGEDNTFFELYYADATATGKLTRPRSFSSTLNSQLHEGPSTFSTDGMRMFFTRNNSKAGVRKADASGVVRLSIFEATKGPYDWENIRPLPFNNENYSCMHPCLSADGTTLFFASDMEGGFGGMDIYRSTLTDGKWSTPENLGSRFNSSANEVFPFIYQQGLLFFASDRDGGYGGLDIYTSEIGRETAPLLLKPPFNSPSDDFGLILRPTGQQGYFTSSRANGAGNDDLYFFDASESYWGELVKGEQVVQLTVIDPLRQKRLEGAALRLFADFGNGFERQEGQLYDKRLVPSEYAREELIFQTFQRDETELGPPDALTNEQGQALMSVQRGVKYLIQIRASGFQIMEYPFSLESLDGDSILVVRLDREQCVTRKGRLIQTENKEPLPNGIIKIQSLCLEKPMYLSTDSLGFFSWCFQPDCNYLISGLQEGFLTQSIPLSSRNMTDSLHKVLVISIESETQSLPQFQSLREGSVIVLENIYYDFDKSAIRSGDAAELDQLARVMLQYPSMEVQLISHTDSRGNRRYNKVLSELRSESARDYLVAKGISRSRITTLGKGESELRNECDDKTPCPPEKHQYNRRTEVVVTRIDNQDKIKFQSGKLRNN
jgi:outer membrane protein OmpA-like peptidoglycan-associated protein/Tol biopolymer transport system component